MPNSVSTGLPNPASYDTSVAGVVLDNVTGLLWLASVPSQTFDLDGGSLYCASMTLADAGTWRLPTVIELQSLLDTGVDDGGALINPNAFPGTPANPFWSATPAAGVGYSGQAWVVGFDIGHTYFYPGTDSYSVRCVQ